MKSVILLLVLSVCLWVPPAVAGPSLKVNTSIKPPFSTEEETGFFDLLIEELGKRINCGFILVRQPAARALISVNEGLSDAELPRIAGLQKKYPNLVQVEEKIIDYNFVAFTRAGIRVKSWDDLAGKKVGYLIGWKIFETNVPQTANVIKLQKPHLLFDMLDSGRLDVALYEKHAGLRNIREDGHSSVIESDTPLAVRPMYMYLHKSHAGLVPLLAQALKDMKADGTYQRIAKQTLGQ
ncbi:MAG: transporter substrate-binding domain-containing protein [Pseudodesulfovibrio sp.]